MSDLLLDTFTGSGTLATHTSDNGVTYDDVSSSWVASNALVSGGFVYPGVTGSCGFEANISLPTSFSLFLDFVIETPLPTDYGQYNVLFGRGVNLQFDNTKLYWTVGGFTGARGNLLYTVGAHSLQLDVTPTDTTLTLDGVVLGHWTGATSTQSKWADFDMDNSGTSHWSFIKYDKLRIAPAGPPPPPPAFWTQNKLSTEVDA